MTYSLCSTSTGSTCFGSIGAIETTTTTTTTKKSILVIGATGRIGLKCLQALAFQKPNRSRPKLHAFCRDPTKLRNKDKNLCNSIVMGDARCPSDIKRALYMTKANTVLVAIGMSGAENKNMKTNLRTASALALANVLTEIPEFHHIRVVVVSRTRTRTANGVGFGVGVGNKLMDYRLRHVLKDHHTQEDVFWSSPALLERTCIVRPPTTLTDNEAIGKVEAFVVEDHHDGGSKISNKKKQLLPDTKRRTINNINKADRADVAAWITRAICNDSVVVPWGMIVNIAGVKI